MNSVLLSDDELRLGVILPALDPARFHYTVSDFTNPALSMAEFDCIAPLKLKDYFDLWARGDLARLRVLIPSSELMELLDNKYECNRFLTARGFAAFVPAMLERVQSWPIIYKKKRDAFGIYSFLCHSQAQLDAFEAATVTTEYFRQQYIPGPVEYATHMLSVAGRVVYHSTFRYTFDTAFFVKGKQWEPPHPELCECACPGPLSAILGELEYSGTSCFNYKMIAGEPKIFEINPRVGHSLCYDFNNYLAAYVRTLRDTR